MLHPLCYPSRESVSSCWSPESPVIFSSNGVREGMQHRLKGTVASDVDFSRPGCVREEKAQMCWVLLLLVIFHRFIGGEEGGRCAGGVCLLGFFFVGFFFRRNSNCKNCLDF